MPKLMGLRYPTHPLHGIRRQEHRTADASTTVTANAHLLTRGEAEQIALANNPAIHISQLLAKVQHQFVRERRADVLPNLTGNMTVVGAKEDSRLSSWLADFIRAI